MNFTIRKATIQDANNLAELMLYAMEDIVYDFIGMKNLIEAKNFLKSLIEQTNNQYSFENCWLLEIDQKTIGSFTLYDGAKLFELREPVLRILKTKYNRNLNPLAETQEGEIYIDTIAIYPQYRGLGYGNMILDYIINDLDFSKDKTLGLLVDYNNPNAKKLYESKGFVVVGKKQLMNEQHYHMQYLKSV